LGSVKVGIEDTEGRGEGVGGATVGEEAGELVKICTEPEGGGEEVWKKVGATGVTTGVRVEKGVLEGEEEGRKGVSVREKGGEWVVKREKVR